MNTAVCDLCNARVPLNDFWCTDCVNWESGRRREAINEAYKVSLRFAREIEAVIQCKPVDTELLFFSKRNRIKALRELVKIERARLDNLKEKIPKLRATNSSRRAGLKSLEKKRVSWEAHRKKLEAHHEKQHLPLEERESAIMSFARRASEALQKLLPIRRQERKKQCTIGVLVMPDRVYERGSAHSQDWIQISAALGLLVHYLQLLSRFYFYPLPHATLFCGSTSRIWRHTNHDHPLYIPMKANGKAVPTEAELREIYRALQLLDQNVLALCQHVHVSSSDLKKMCLLPNLLSFLRSEAKTRALNSPRRPPRDRSRPADTAKT